MMKHFVVSIPEVPNYLREWLVWKYGPEPIAFSRGSVERSLLEAALRPQPPAIAKRQPPGLRIRLPFFHYRDPRTYNYLPPESRAELLRLCRGRFDRDLIGELPKLVATGLSLQDAIYAWMEQRGIETTAQNWMAIAKRYQRRLKK